MGLGVWLSLPVVRHRAEMDKVTEQEAAARGGQRQGFRVQSGRVTHCTRAARLAPAPISGSMHILASYGPTQ